MKNIVFAVAAAALTCVLTTSTFATDAPGPISTTTQPSLEFCRHSFENTLDQRGHVLEQLDKDIVAAQFRSKDDEAMQRAVCLVYYQGMLDYIAVSGPKA